MSLHDTVRWVVCYDIRDADRGMQVLRFMKSHGLPLQYSVFVVEASAARMRQLMGDMAALIVPSVDDVRAYRWPDHAENHELGCPRVPEGMVIGSAPGSPRPGRKVVRARATPH